MLKRGRRVEIFFEIQKSTSKMVIDGAYDSTYFLEGLLTKRPC